MRSYSGAHIRWAIRVEEHNVEFFEKHYGELGCTNIRTTLVIHWGAGSLQMVSI